MRVALLLLLALLGSYANCSALIGLGYHHKDVTMWRFWEIKDGIPVPEMLVYNTGDSAISFTVRKTFVVDEIIDSGKRDWFNRESAEYEKDTFIRTAIIPAHQFGIFVIGQGNSTPGGYAGAFINGSFAGIAGNGLASIEPFTGGKFNYKYYSFEGLGGTHCYGLICKNQLFTRRGETDTTTVYFDFEDKKTWQFFQGVSKIKAKINDGVADAAFKYMQSEYSLDGNKQEVEFPVNMGLTQPYELIMSTTVAPVADPPALYLTLFFNNGSSGISMPVFAEL